MTSPLQQASTVPCSRVGIPSGPPASHIACPGSAGARPPTLPSGHLRSAHAAVVWRRRLARSSPPPRRDHEAFGRPLAVCVAEARESGGGDDWAPSTLVPVFRAELRIVPPASTQGGAPFAMMSKGLSIDLQLMRYQNKEITTLDCGGLEDGQHLSIRLLKCINEVTDQSVRVETDRFCRVNQLGRPKRIFVRQFDALVI